MAKSKSKDKSKSKEPAASKPAAKPKTNPMIKKIYPEALAARCAKKNKGKVLRFRINNGGLTVLLTDGRKFYVNMEK
jgi:hypothetical protein